MSASRPAAICPISPLDSLVGWSKNSRQFRVPSAILALNPILATNLRPPIAETRRSTGCLVIRFRKLNSMMELLRRLEVLGTRHPSMLRGKRIDFASR